MNTAKILVFKHLGRSLTSREQADLLYSVIKERAEKVIIDFDSVDFMSRSFADQFYKGFLDLNMCDQVISVNGNEVVCEMLNSVIKTQNGHLKAKIPFKLKTLTDKEKLKKYLLSID